MKWVKHVENRVELEMGNESNRTTKHAVNRITTRAVNRITTQSQRQQLRGIVREMGKTCRKSC